MIEINTGFYQQYFGADGFFETQNVLTWMEIFYKDVMNRLVSNNTRSIIIVGVSGVFESVLLG